MSALLPGIAAETGAVFDERARPDFRDVFGALCSGAREVRSAVTRVRLTTLDLTPGELAGVEEFRVVVAQLSALQLTSEVRALGSDPRRADRIEVVRGLLESGRLMVRAAPLAGWSPDFTVFTSSRTEPTVLTGFHWFERPYPNRGPALTTLHRGDGALRAARRHDELWAEAHDVGPAVWNILARAERVRRSRRALSG